MNLKVAVSFNFSIRDQPKVILDGIEAHTRVLRCHSEQCDITGCEVACVQSKFADINLLLDLVKRRDRDCPRGTSRTWVDD